MLRHGETRGLTFPMDIMVSELGARRPSKVAVPHACTKSLPESALVDAGDGLYVSSPEFCFFQMAGEYPLAKLIALGVELCGSYSLPGKTSVGTEKGTSDRPSQNHDALEQPIYNLPPLTSLKKLKAFAAHMGGWPGYKQTVKALRHIADNSASPMEAILFILLTLPLTYGGYGLPIPELNGRIYPVKGAKKFSGREYYRGDLLWRDAGVVAEYNSDIEHTGPERIAADAIRQSDLGLCGINVVPVTIKQIKNLELLDKVARQFAAGIGKRLRCNNPEFAEVQRNLYNTLYR